MHAVAIYMHAQLKLIHIRTMELPVTARVTRTYVRTHLAEHMCMQQCDDVSRMYVRGNLFYADVVHVCICSTACMHAHSSTYVRGCARRGFPENSHHIGSGREVEIDHS